MKHPLLEETEQELKNTLAGMPIDEIRRLVALGMVYEKNVNFSLSGRDREIEEKAWQLFSIGAAYSVRHAYQVAADFIDDREARRRGEL